MAEGSEKRGCGRNPCLYHIDGKCYPASQAQSQLHHGGPEKWDKEALEGYLERFLPLREFCQDKDAFDAAVEMLNEAIEDSNS